jgi:hypothetical protein
MQDENRALPHWNVEPSAEPVDGAALLNNLRQAAYLAPLRRHKWYVYSKPPFGGPEAVLAYLARYTHRVAISNRRLIAFDHNGRHLQVQGLSRRRPRAIQGHDPRNR